MSAENESGRDWPEDFAHENGKYVDRCVVCNHDFMGHKRRVECRVCNLEAQLTQLQQDNQRLREANESRDRQLLNAVADHVENSGKPGPGGVDVTGGIPSEVYVAIGRDRYDDEYEVAADTAESVRTWTAHYLRSDAALTKLHAALTAVPEVKPLETE